MWNHPLAGWLFHPLYTLGPFRFNSIHHGKLYKKKRFIGFSERCIPLFKSCLCRTQTGRIGNENSSDMEIFADIARGTALGRLIFIFYLNDIAHYINIVTCLDLLMTVFYTLIEIIGYKYFRNYSRIVCK